MNSAIVRTSDLIRQPRVHASTSSATDPVLPKPTCGLIETAPGDRGSHERTGGALIQSSFQAALAGCRHQCIRWRHPRICLARCLHDMGAPSSRLMSPDEWNRMIGRIRAKALWRHTVRLHGVRLVAAGAPVQSSFAEAALLPQHDYITK